MKPLLNIKNIVSLIFIMAFINSDCGSENKGNTEPITPQNYYSYDKPGHYSKELARSHTPIVKIYPDKKENNIVIYVPLEDSSPEHYIQNIGLVDKNDMDILVKEGNKGNYRGLIKQEFTLHPLPSKGSGVRAFAACSLHDVWVSDVP